MCWETTTNFMLAPTCQSSCPNRLSRTLSSQDARRQEDESDGSGNLAMLASVDKGKPLLPTERKKSILDSRGARSSTPQDSYTARSARGDEVLQQHHQQLHDDKVAVEGLSRRAPCACSVSGRQR